MNSKQQRALVAFITSNPAGFVSALVNTVDTSIEIGVKEKAMYERAEGDWIINFLIQHDDGAYTTCDEEAGWKLVKTEALDTELIEIWSCPETTRVAVKTSMNDGYAQIAIYFTMECLTVGRSPGKIFANDIDAEMYSIWNNIITGGK